jgi:hypothetical protein
MSRKLFNPGVHRGEFVPLSLEEMRVAYETFLDALEGRHPQDPTFPPVYLDANTGETKPVQDTPSNRAWHATGKMFEDEAKRMSFYWRAEQVMPITIDKRYAKYMDREAGSMHVALMSAVAMVRGNFRTPKKTLRAAFDAEFRRQLAKTVDPGGAARGSDGVDASCSQRH